MVAPVDRAFQRAIHTQRWWQTEVEESNAALAPFQGVTAETLTPEVTMGLFNVLIQELGRVALITKTMALEKPRRRGRPIGSRNITKQPEYTADANDQGLIEFMGMRLTAEQARELASRLVSAAEQVDGVEGQEDEIYMETGDESGTEFGPDAPED